MKPLLALALALLSASCAIRQLREPFRVVPAKPDYLLRSPERRDTPFPEVLARFTGVGQTWVDLRPLMQLRIENAYRKEGAPKGGLEGYLGTEVAWYAVRPGAGLRLVTVQSHIAQRPPGQPPVQALVPASQRRFRHYRFFHEVLFHRKSELRGAVLLGAGSLEDLDRLTAKLSAEPEAVCGGQAVHCTLFPEACTVALEMEIVVNGARRTVLWGSSLLGVATKARQVELLRPHGGRLTPVELNLADPLALRVPLLPGDRVTWGRMTDGTP